MLCIRRNVMMRRTTTLFLASMGVSCMSRDAEGPSFVRSILLGDIVNSETMAASVARVVVEGRYGKALLEKNEPLVVIDRGADWFVKGGANCEGRAEPSCLNVVVRKADGAIMWLGFESPLGKN
jgi:hypothetical protein